MKLVISSLGFCLVSSLFSGAFALSNEEKIGNCRSSDAVCVGKVLLDAIESGSSSSGVVDYFHSDKCEDGFLARVATTTPDRENFCKKMATTIPGTQYVYGVKIAGQCMDITDSDFASACMRFQ